VEVADSGVGPLNGHTTKRDSIVSVEGLGVVLFTGQAFRIRVRVTKCTWVMSRKFQRADKRLPRFTETKATLSVDIVRV
jgi:hypothetical protein